MAIDPQQSFPVGTAQIADPDTGAVTQVWRQFFLSLWQRTGGGQGLLSDQIKALAELALITASAAATTAGNALAQAAASLKKADNLSDLNNVATARSNLGLGPTATSATIAGWGDPTGTGSRAAFDMDWTTTVSVTPTQGQVEDIRDQLIAVQKALGQLVVDQTTFKSIGP